MRSKVGRFERRQAFMLTAVLLVLTLFAGRLVYVQVVAGPALAAEAMNYRVKSESLVATRGDIVDRDGAVMATSVQRVRVTANQQEIAKFKRTLKDSGEVLTGPAGVAHLLAPVLGQSESELTDRLTGDSKYVIVAKSVTVEKWLEIAALGSLGGIAKEDFTVREYPSGTVAGNLIGYSYQNESEPGKVYWTGLEQAENDVLTGTDGERTVEKGLTGREIPGGEEQVTAAKPGQSVVLTLDQDMQLRTEEMLQAQVKATGADWGAVVVERVKTGEVLVLADSDPMDPNDPGATAGSQRGSRAAEAIFDPGSTAKTVTMAALLESGLADPLTQVQAPYSYTAPNGQVFHDSHQHSLQNLTLTGVLSNSSNTGTVILGSQLPVQSRYDWLQKFGFGTKTGIELPVESAGILNPADQWDGRTAYAVLFGQGVAATALQVTQVYAAIANGGVMEPMHLIGGTRDSDGTFTPSTTGEARQVVSSETASTLMTMLESTVADGTGKSASIPGYRVAGKTGTAQATGPDGSLSSIAASFIGVLPADDPQVAITVVLFNPKTSVYGGDVAAPLFEKVGTMVVQQLGIAPSATEAQLFPTTW